MEPGDLFSPTYDEARTKFLKSCENAGARVESYPNPLAGPDGGALYTDVAALGPDDGRAVLGLSSATHGVEGFTGSAIQTGLVRDGIGGRLGPGQRVVLVHAINPYGFAHLRRVNEDNVDLNRNFIDHEAPHPKNSQYDSLAGAIAPVSTSGLARLMANGRLTRYALWHGRAALQAAITAGQYAHPDGLFYGGDSQTWSNRTFRRIVETHLGGASRVVFIDLHTGLGPFGHGEVILTAPPDSPAFARAAAWWLDRTRSTKAGNSASADLAGAVIDCVSQSLPQAEITAVGLEYGTVPLNSPLTKSALDTSGLV